MLRKGNIFKMDNLVLYIILYLIFINLITFLAMYIDKKKAENGGWRIKETTLFMLALIGGEIGGIVGMYKFRHKTKKYKFVIGFPIIIIIHILIIIAIKM